MPIRDTRTSAQRWADAVTWFCGSWHFFTACALLIVGWIAWMRSWDPYPFILLNLFLTVISTLQSPLIMMSQNREQERDREHFGRMDEKLDALLKRSTHEARIDAIRRLIKDMPEL